MTDHSASVDLTPREKRLLFWASFLALTAAGVGFAFRVAMGGAYGKELSLSNLEVGQIFGAALWPIAITMILFSLVVDRLGYKMPMIIAFALQAASGVLTCISNDYGSLYLASLCAGLGHGVVEAVINPICAAVYPKEKTKWLAILHAAWPAGLVLGTLLVKGADGMVGPLDWRMHALWILVPAIPYVLMFLPCRFPVDERVQAGVPFSEMLRQAGFLTAFLAGALMTYEIGNQVFGWTMTAEERGASDVVANWFYISMGIGVGIGGLFGFAVRSLGQPLFFLMCLLMIPLATTELGTDAWIRDLMTPVLGNFDWVALVCSASIMLVLRVFAGSILKFFSPPALLCVSGIFSAVGLYWLSSAAGFAVIIAFILYAMGQTYYWPCVLGFTSERYPQGGALTLNTVSAIGLLSVGIIGAPLLGAAFDESIHTTVKAEAPALEAAARKEGGFLWMSHTLIDPEKAGPFLEALPAAEQTRVQEIYNNDPANKGTAQVQAGRDALAYAMRFPFVLFLAFGAIALWFKMRGGYKPVELGKSDPPA